MANLNIKLYCKLLLTNIYNCKSDVNSVTDTQLYRSSGQVGFAFGGGSGLASNAGHSNPEFLYPRIPRINTDCPGYSGAKVIIKNP